MRNSAEHVHGEPSPLFERSIDIPAYDLLIRHSKTPFSTNAPHTEGEMCELVIYTEAGKSVCVENTVYVTTGFCAFTFRPGELHFGIHRPMNVHERYVLTFHPEKFRKIPGGDSLLRIFFDRDAGTRNMIVLPYEAERLVCSYFASAFMASRRGDAASDTVILSYIICLFDLLGQYFIADQTNRGTAGRVLHTILDDMENRYMTAIPLTDYASAAGISLSTMERFFRQSLQMTPGQYLHARRMECAKHMLRDGSNVSDACFLSGFRDYSHFISDFKRQVGMTPAQYRKNRNQSSKANTEDKQEV